MSVCTRYCDGCDYRGQVSSGGKGVRRACDYLLITGRVRGCPAGNGCRRKIVSGRPAAGMELEIAQDVRSARERVSPRAAAAEEVWRRRDGDPAAQIRNILKWDALDDGRLRKVASDMRRWQRRREAKNDTA